MAFLVVCCSVLFALLSYKLFITPNFLKPANWDLAHKRPRVSKAKKPFLLSIGNSMVSSAIWGKHARVSFSKTFKIAFETHECTFFPNCKRNHIYRSMIQKLLDVIGSSEFPLCFQPIRFVCYRFFHCCYTHFLHCC